MLDQRADKARQSTKHYSAERKQRKDGSVAATTPPLSAPKWAVHKDWRGQGKGEILNSFGIIILILIQIPLTIKTVMKLRLMVY